MFTRHGHHIPGTVKDLTRPEFTKRCGGVNHCKQCTGEWEKWFEMNREENFVTEVPLKDKPGGKVIGTCKVEKTKNGDLLFHAQIDDEHISHLMSGFHIGALSIADKQ
jgi:hypothetical protein